MTKYKIKYIDGPLEGREFEADLASKYFSSPPHTYELKQFVIKKGVEKFNNDDPAAMFECVEYQFLKERRNG